MSFRPKKHILDAGTDLFACSETILGPGEHAEIIIDFDADVPAGYMGMLFPRSRFAKQGLLISTPPIDYGYHDKLHAWAFNASKSPITIQLAYPFCQIVYTPVYFKPEHISENASLSRKWDDRCGSTDNA